MSGPKSNTTYVGHPICEILYLPCKKAHQMNIRKMYFRLLLIMVLVDYGHKSKQKKKGKQKLKSRFEGYQDCIAEQATDKQLLEWFSETTLLVSQEGLSRR